MVAETTTTFGALLRRHRVAAGLTQEALAERAGLSVYGVQKLERGATHPYRDTAARLASVLELAADDADRFWAAVEPVRRRGSPPREPPGGKRHHNLPTPLDSFVGREHELANVPPRLEAARLLTLTGTGGSGKTRLAIELARRLVNEYRDGAWLVELAQVTDPTLVPHRLAAVLAVQESAEQPLAQVLVQRLRDTHMLLVLDNCEHMLDACAALVDLLLRECPNLQFIVTSREPVGVSGEVNWNLAPLEPPNDVARSIAEIKRSAAVRLFVDRATAAQPSFVLNPDNASAVAQICRGLDGIPLALELAAARVDGLAPDQLARRLDERFRLLTGGSRASLPRQQTLSATIDWSYQLLTEAQQRVLERLSVFASGWTVEAAEAVCAGDGVGAEAVLDALLQLIRKSLVVRTATREGSARYGMLETIRQYAWGRLLDRGTEQTAARQRHAAYYSALVERLDPAWPTSLLPFSGETLTAPVFQILDDAHDNVRVALKWWLETRSATEGLLLTRALGAFWQWVDIPVDGRRWMEAMLDLAAEPTGTPAVPAPIHAQALLVCAIVARFQGDYIRARELSHASVALWRTLDDSLGLAHSLVSLGLDYVVCADFGQADATLVEALALARTRGEAFTLSTVLMGLGLSSRAQGEQDRAAELFREAAAVGQRIERANYRMLAVIRARMQLGCTESERGASDRAMPLLKESLAGVRESGMAGNVLARCLDGVAAEASRAGESERAALLFGAAEAQWRRAGCRRLPFDSPIIERVVRSLEARMGEDSFGRAWAEGHAMDLAQVFAYALGERA